MELTKSRQAERLHENESYLRMLDTGIDDMEAGRELPLDDAFKKITELRDARRMEEKQEVHVLRVLREERNWRNILKKTNSYTYPG